MDKHDRPYKCLVADCTHSNGFSAKGDLERHKRAVHKQLILHEQATQLSNLLYYCPEPNCPRSSSSSRNKPFSRKDHRQEHIKRKHKDLFSKPPANVQGEFNSPAANQDIWYPDSTKLASPIHQAHETIPGARKRRRLEGETRLSENADPANEEIYRLQAETEEWKGKVKDMERKLELSRKREERLLALLENALSTQNRKQGEGKI